MRVEVDCPSCSTQYALDTDLLSSRGGGSVQCGRCKSVWFYTPPASDTCTPPPQTSATTLPPRGDASSRKLDDTRQDECPTADESVVHRDELERLEERLSLVEKTGESVVHRDELERLEERLSLVERKVTLHHPDEERVDSRAGRLSSAQRRRETRAPTAAHRPLTDKRKALAEELSDDSSGEQTQGREAELSSNRGADKKVRKKKAKRSCRGARDASVRVPISEDVRVQADEKAANAAGVARRLHSRRRKSVPPSSDHSLLASGVDASGWEVRTPGHFSGPDLNAGVHEEDQAAIGQYRQSETRAHDARLDAMEERLRALESLSLSASSPGNAEEPVGQGGRADGRSQNGVVPENEQSTRGVLHEAALYPDGYAQYNLSHALVGAETTSEKEIVQQGVPAYPSRGKDSALGPDSWKQSGEVEERGAALIQDDAVDSMDGVGSPRSPNAGRTDSATEAQQHQTDEDDDFISSLMRSGSNSSAVVSGGGNSAGETAPERMIGPDPRSEVRHGDGEESDKRADSLAELFSMAENDKSRTGRGEDENADGGLQSKGARDSVATQAVRILDAEASAPRDRLFHADSTGSTQADVPPATDAADGKGEGDQGASSGVEFVMSQAPGGAPAPDSISDADALDSPPRLAHAADPMSNQLSGIPAAPSGFPPMGEQTNGRPPILDERVGRISRPTTVPYGRRGMGSSGALALFIAFCGACVMAVIMFATGPEYVIDKLAGVVEAASGLVSGWMKGSRSL